MSDSAVRVQTDPRISRRRKAVARSKRKRYLTGGALLLGTLTLIYVMFWSPLLSVREVRILGARHTSSNEVAAAAGLDGSDNLLRVSTASIAERAERLPWVRSAEVDRMLPGTVRVRVVERRPTLVLVVDGHRWTVAADGMVLSEGEAAKGLPVLAGVEVGGVEPGDSLRTEESVDALKAYRSLPPALERRVAGVFAPTRERITFSLAEGTVVRFGAAEHLAAKTEVLRKLLARIASQGRVAAYVDVRVPTSPAVSTHDAPAATATPAS